MFTLYMFCVWSENIKNTSTCLTFNHPYSKCIIDMKHSTQISETPVKKMTQTVICDNACENQTKVPEYIYNM